MIKERVWPVFSGGNPYLLQPWGCDKLMPASSHGEARKQKAPAILRNRMSTNRVVATSTFGDPAEATRRREANAKRQAKEEKRAAKKKPKFKHWKQVLHYMHLEPEVVKRRRQTKQRTKPGQAKSHKRAERQPPKLTRTLP